MTLDEPLTEEMCYKAGLCPVGGHQQRYFVPMSNYVIDFRRGFIGRGLCGATAFAWPNPIKVRHLQALCVLAGYELDLEKLL